MQVVAAVVFGLDVAGSRWIARERVEIDDAIELTARADPVVDCHADLLLIGVIVAFERAALECFLERRQRRAEDAKPVSMGALDQLTIAVSDLLCSRLLGVGIEDHLRPI